MCVCGGCTGLMNYDNDQSPDISGQIKRMSGQIKFGQIWPDNFLCIINENSLSLQKKMNVRTIFSPCYKHWDEY